MRQVDLAAAEQLLSPFFGVEFFYTIYELCLQYLLQISPSSSHRFLQFQTSYFSAPQLSFFSPDNLFFTYSFFSHNLFNPARFFYA